MATPPLFEITKEQIANLPDGDRWKTSQGYFVWLPDVVWQDEAGWWCKIERWDSENGLVYCRPGSMNHEVRIRYLTDGPNGYIQAIDNLYKRS